IAMMSPRPGHVQSWLKSDHVGRSVGFAWQLPRGTRRSALKGRNAQLTVFSLDWLKRRIPISLLVNLNDVGLHRFDIQQCNRAAVGHPAAALAGVEIELAIFQF